MLNGNVLYTSAMAEQLYSFRFNIYIFIRLIIRSKVLLPIIREPKDPSKGLHRGLARITYRSTLLRTESAKLRKP